MRNVQVIRIGSARGILSLKSEQPARTAQGEEFVRYWSSLPTSGTSFIPHRADFQPGAIKALLPYVVIVDVDPFDLHYRLVGDAVRRRTGLNFTSRKLSDFATSEQVQRAVMRAHVTFAHPCGMLCHYEEKPLSGAPVMVELTGLPLMTEADKPNQLISLAMPLDYEQPYTDSQLEDFRVNMNHPFSYLDIGAGVPYRANA